AGESPPPHRSVRAGSENWPLAVRSLMAVLTATYMAAKYPMRSPSALQRSTIASSAPMVASNVGARGTAIAAPYRHPVGAGAKLGGSCHGRAGAAQRRRVAAAAQP